MGSMLNEDMLKFLNEIGVVTVTEVHSVKVKDCDDDIGFIGEHYVVDCKVKNIGDRMCYVDSAAFKKFRGKKQVIIWSHGQ